MTDSAGFLEERSEGFQRGINSATFTDAVKTRESGGISSFISDYRDDKSTYADVYNSPVKNNSQIGNTEAFSLERFERKPIKIDVPKLKRETPPLVMRPYAEDFSSNEWPQQQEYFTKHPSSKAHPSTGKGVFLLLLALFGVVFLVSSFSKEEILYEGVKSLQSECNKIISPIIMQERAQVK